MKTAVIAIQNWFAKHDSTQQAYPKPILSKKGRSACREPQPAVKGRRYLAPNLWFFSTRHKWKGGGEAVVCCGPVRLVFGGAVTLTMAAFYVSHHPFCCDMNGHKAWCFHHPHLSSHLPHLFCQWKKERWNSLRMPPQISDPFVPF